MRRQFLETIDRAISAGEVITERYRTAQLDIAIEELAELIVALQHYRRGKCGLKELVSEIADGLFVVTQLSVIFGISDVGIVLGEKIERTTRRLGL